MTHDPVPHLHDRDDEAIPPVTPRPGEDFRHFPDAPDALPGVPGRRDPVDDLRPEGDELPF